MTQLRIQLLPTDDGRTLVKVEPSQHPEHSWGGTRALRLDEAGIEAMLHEAGESYQRDRGASLLREAFPDFFEDKRPSTPSP